MKRIISEDGRVIMQDTGSRANRLEEEVIRLSERLERLENKMQSSCQGGELNG